MAERRTYQGYEYERTAEGWKRVGTAPAQPTGPVMGGIPLTGPDPTLPSKIRKGNNDAAASDYDPAKARNDARKGEYEIRTQPTKDNITLTGDLAKRYTTDPAVKQYTAAIQSYARALGAKKDTPQGDLSLIYAFAKIMDPDSVVREGEANSVSNSDTLAGQIVARYRKELGEGGTFSPEARKNLLDEMRNAMGALNASYVQARETYGSIAKQNGLDEKQVIGPHAGLPFSKKDAEFTGTTEAKRDFYGNVIAPGQPIGGVPDLPNSTLPPSEGRREIDPTGASRFSTDRDRQYAAVAQAAFNNGADRAQMDAIAAAYGAPSFGEDLDQAIDIRRRGGRAQFSIPASGQRDASLLGSLMASTPGTAAGGYLNGALLGGLDEITAGVNSVINGTPFSGELREANAKKQAAAEASPWAYGAGNIIGGITTGAGLGTLGLGSRLPLLSDIGLGAAGGALEENNNRVGGGIIGGLAGGATGALLRGITASPGRPGGVDLPISQNVERAGADQVRARLEEAARLGVPMAIADADPILSSLAGSATRLSPEAERIAIGGMLPRSRGQIDRFGQAIERDLGPLSDPMRQSDALLEQARTAAAPLYEQAYKAPVIGTPTLDSLINTPFGRQAVGKARTIAANERRDPAAMGFRLDADGNVVLEPTVNLGMDEAGSLTTFQNPAQQPGYTTQTLDYAKRGMDDVLEQYRNPITGKLDLTTAGRAENGVRADFLTELDKLNPAYAQARAAYQGPMELRDALAAGRDAVRQSPREVQTVAGRSSPAEMEQMRLGYRVGLNDRANDMRYSSNPFEGVLGTPAAEQRLSAVYGDTTPGVTRLLRQRDLERQLAGSTNEVLGNSKTAKRLMADESFMGGIPGGIIDVGADVLTGNVPVGSAIRAFGASALRDRAKMGAMRGAHQRAAEMAPLLFNTDTPAAIDALDEILARTSAYRDRQRWQQPIAGSTGAVIGGMVPGWLLGGN